MNDFIAKPVNPESLISTLVKWLPVAETASAAVEKPPCASDLELLRNLTGFNDQRLRCLVISLGGQAKVAAAILDFLESYRDIDNELAEWQGQNASEPALAKLHAMKLIAIELGAHPLALLVNDLEKALAQNVWPEDKILRFASAWRTLQGECAAKLDEKKFDK